MRSRSPQASTKRRVGDPPRRGAGKERASLGLFYVSLAALTLVAHGQVVGFDFVTWDDFAYVKDNGHVRAGLTLAGVRWAFTSTHGGHWHPLTSLSHMLDCSLYGMNAAGHHATNLLLHVANVLLLFAVLETMTRAAWASGLVAALFAVHPLHVESVAWISDRKDLLSTFFAFLSLAAYAAYARRPARRPYAAALVLFACALMAKATVMTLPILLLLLDAWPLQRNRSPRHLLVEKLPFAALASASALISFLIVRNLPESVTHGSEVSFPARVANAVVSYARYIVKTIWPTGLGIVYPHPNLPAGTPWGGAEVAAAAGLLIAFSAAAFALRRRRYVAVGWLWYVVTLAPVIGLVQIGPQAMADRYTYLPLVGLFVIAAWAGTEASSAAPGLRRLPAVAAGFVLAAAVAATWVQSRTWHDSDALYAHALRVAPDSPLLHTNLAILRRSQGRIDEAIEHLRAALRVDPELPQAQYSLANALAARGELQPAIEHYRRAVEIDPGFVLAHYNLGRTLHSAGQSAEALEHYRRAVEIRPDFFQALNDLGYVLHSLGRLDEAIDYYRRALRIADEARIHRNLARALSAQGKVEEANEHLRRAAR